MAKKFIFLQSYSKHNLHWELKFLAAIVSKQAKQSKTQARSAQKTTVIYFVIETKHRIIEKETCLMKVLAIHANCRHKLWLN